MTQYNIKGISIRTVKDLKEILQELPDDMNIMGYTGGNGDLYTLGYWVVTKEPYGAEQDEDDNDILKEYPKGLLTISID